MGELALRQAEATLSLPHPTSPSGGTLGCGVGASLQSAVSSIGPGSKKGGHRGTAAL